MALNNALTNIRDNVEDLQAGVAGNYAASTHQFDSRGGLQLSFAMGAYESQGAGSVALGGSITEDIFVNFNATVDSRGGQGYGLGLNFRF
jgi:hypothetical protein